MSAFAESVRTAVDLIVHADAVLFHTVALSLQVSGTACLVAAGFGLAFGAWLSVARFPGHRTLVWLLNTLLALPSVVVGLIVYLLLSRSGRWLVGHPVHADGDGDRADHPGAAGDRRADPSARR